MKYLAPAYIYTPEGLQANKLLAISEDGLIDSISDLATSAFAPSDVELLPGVALLPGFVNVHSHVFQRALRGHTHRPLSQKDTFWTWRNAMYAEAQRLTPDSLFTLALQTYREMLAAGYTSVGEFHYVHHQPGGQPYADPNAMSEAILQAGREAGIRVVLLMTAYAQAGFHMPPEEGQRRFCDASVEALLARVEELRDKGELIGVAPHSVRAVPENWFRAIADYSRTHHLPLHVHADEQVAEIEQCQAEYGCTPIELLERYGALGSQTTIIHATHANDQEIALLARHRCTVCVCPTTEGDLGDGIAPYAELLAARRYQRRRILIADEVSSPGTLLLDYGTQLGATALGLHTGVLLPGMYADFIGVDLNHPAMAGWNVDDFLDVLFFGVSSEVITQTWVGGSRRGPG